MAAVISIDSVGDSQEAVNTSSPGTAKLRVNGNDLEASVNGSAWSEVPLGGLELLSGAAEDISPDFTVNETAVELLSYEVPTELTAEKVVMLTAQGTAYSSAGATNFEFYIDVNETPTTRRRFYFNQINVHATWSGSWLLTLPVGAVTIKLYGIRNGAGGAITIGADDFVNMTFLG